MTSSVSSAKSETALVGRSQRMVRPSRQRLTSVMAGDGGRLSLAFIFLPMLVLLVNGDLPKGQSTVVSETSSGDAVITVISEDKVKENHIKSPEGDVSVRLYCHGVCESSYNQLQVGDTLMIPNNGSADIISGHHPDTATHQRVLIPGCDPLATTYETRPHIVFYTLCDSGPSTSNSLTVFGVEQRSASWSVTEPFNCFLDDSAKVGDVGMFFHSRGEIYVAFTSTKGLGLCSLLSDTPYFIDVPSNCPYIARLSQFDPENILVECTSSKDSQRVVQVWLFSIPDAKFVQQLPLQQYNVGQIVFSGDRLVVATWEDKTVMLANLSESNPPSATAVAKGNVDSAHIVSSGIPSQLVVVTEGGVQQYDLHAVFDGNAKPKTLEGSQNVLTRFDDPSSPTAQVVEQCLIIPTEKDGTYGMALLSLNGDKPKVIPGVRPARFAVYPGVNVTNSTEPTVIAQALVYGVYGAIAGGGGGVVILVLIVVVAIVAIVTRKLKGNRPTASRPQVAQDPGTTTSLVAGISPVPSSSHLSHTTSRTQPLTNADYMAVPLADSDVELLNPGVESEPEEAVDNRRGVISLAPPAPQRRPPSEEPYGQSLSRP